MSVMSPLDSLCCTDLTELDTSIDEVVGVAKVDATLYRHSHGVRESITSKGARAGIVAD